MAQSARLQSLLANRTGSLYGTSGRIRLLNPASTTISSIAKKAVTSELDIMTKNYNAGTVSNDDFQAFLQKMLTTSGISDVDKADIRNQMADFSSRIIGDRLVQAYKSAPDNTLQQVQAAQSLASYFRGRAAGMQTDTPAYNDNIQNAISYEQKVVDIQNNVEKINRQNLRYLVEQKVNKLPSGTSQNAAAKAEMWKQLYDQAVIDGDTTAANQYAANYQQAVTQSDTFSDQETAKTNKKTLTDFINTTLNDYHDGRISGDDALTQLEQANSFAYNINDTAALNRLNGLSITINREIDKGITYSSTNGLSEKSKGGGSGGGDLYLNPDGSVSYGGGYTAPTRNAVATKITSGGVGQGKATGGKTVGASNVGTLVTGIKKPTSFSEIDLTYKDALIKLVDDLNHGKIDPSGYKTGVLVLKKDRENNLSHITAGLQNILVQNPKARLGKTDVQTIFDGYTKELTATTQEYNGINTGNRLLMIGSHSVTDPSGVQYNVPEYQFLPKDKNKSYIDTGGIYYPTVTNELTASFNSKQEAQDLIDGLIRQDPKTYSKDNIVIKQNRSTNGFEVINKVDEGQPHPAPISYKQDTVDVTDTNGNSITYQNDPKYGWLPVATGPKTGALRNQALKESKAAFDNGQEYAPKFMNFGQLNNQNPVYSNGQWQFAKPTEVGVTTGEIVPPKPEFLDQVSKTLDPKQFETPKEAQALSTLPVSQIKVPAVTKIPLSQPAINPTTTQIKPQTIAPAAPKPTAIQQAAKQVGPIKVAPPPQTPAPNPFQDLQKNLGNSVFNWFDNLFKKK